MIENGAHFWLGPKTKLFRMARMVPQANKLVLFVPPLFEDANNTRHAYSKMTQLLLTSNISSIIFDYSGTGDSEGVLASSDVNEWRNEIIAQCIELKEQFSSIEISLISCCSASLIINNAIMEHVDNVIAWHPDLYGQKYVSQLNRMAKLVPADKDYQEKDNCALLAGYEIPNTMLQALNTSNFECGGHQGKSLFWLELNQIGVPAKPRVEFFELLPPTLQKEMLTISASKFWQATELTLPIELMEHTLDWLNEQ